MNSGSVPTSPKDFRKSVMDSGEHHAIKVNRTPSVVRDWRKNTLKTFQTSRTKGSYFPNGIEAELNKEGESIAVSVDSDESFELPPPPSECYDSDGPVKVMSIRSFEDDERVRQQPAFDGSVEESPFL